VILLAGTSCNIFTSEKEILKDTNLKKLSSFKINFSIYLNSVCWTAFAIKNTTKPSEAVERI
jgi:hypothetical protein